MATKWTWNIQLKVSFEIKQIGFGCHKNSTCTSLFCTRLTRGEVEFIDTARSLLFSNHMYITLLFNTCVAIATEIL